MIWDFETPPGDHAVFGIGLLLTVTLWFTYASWPMIGAFASWIRSWFR